MKQDGWKKQLPPFRTAVAINVEAVRTSQNRSKGTQAGEAVEQPCRGRSGIMFAAPSGRGPAGQIHPVNHYHKGGNCMN